MQNAENITVFMAFAAGVLSFFSPCIFPLIPAYISYLTGISFSDLSLAKTKGEKSKIILQSLFFIAGFTIVFVLLGMSASFIGHRLLLHQGLIKKAGGALIIVFALSIMDIIKIPFLQRQKKISYNKKGVSFIGSLLVGAAFAFAWTPCVGPILGSILIYASGTGSIKTGALMLVVYSLGLGVPFLLSAILAHSLLMYIKKIERYMKWIKIASGVVLLVFGVSLFK